MWELWKKPSSTFISLWVQACFTWAAAYTKSRKFNDKVSSWGCWAVLDSIYQRGIHCLKWASSMQSVYVATYICLQFYFTRFHVFANYRQQIPFLSQKLLRKFWLQVPSPYNSRVFVVWKRWQCTCFERWIVYIQCERLCSCSVENIFCGFSLMKHMLLIISNTFFTITISTLWKRLDVCSTIYVLLQMSPL